MLPKQEIIFWDWNGTLLNDTQACVDAMNCMLSARNSASIDVEKYQSIFGFPVKDYYQKLGFDFEQECFEDLSKEFIANYNRNLKTATLQPYAIEVLTYFKRLGKTQVVISAMEQNMLLDQTNTYGVQTYFDAIYGINDIYANSKAYLAKNYIVENKVSAKSIMFIGDTLHDMEVAEEINAQTILVANGHHSRSRLQINGNVVIANLSEFL